MILVVGASGQLGGRIVRRLLSLGLPVRALVRNVSDFATLKDAGASCAIGDLKNPPSLHEATRGVSAVVTTANSVRRGGADTLASVDIQGTCDLVDAAVACGVSRFVYVSAYGASMNHPAPLFAAKAYVEAYLKNSGAAYTILEPNLFMDVWVEAVVANPIAAQRPVVLVGKGLRRHSMVAEADVAQIAACVLEDPDARCKSIAVGGPAAISWNDVVSAYERVLGLAIPVLIEPELSGMPAPVADLLRSLEHFDSPIEMDSIVRRYRIGLTSIDAYATRSLASVR